MRDRGTRSQMQKQLEGVELDAPARIGASVFHKNTPVIDVILRAQSDFQYKDGALNSGVDPKPLAADPWVRRIYDVTTEYHTRTKLKVQIADLLEAFIASSIKDVAKGDRELFERRLMERIS